MLKYHYFTCGFNTPFIHPEKGQTFNLNLLGRGNANSNPDGTIE